MMDPLSNVDRFVALLRLRLAERAHARKARTASAAKAGKVAAPVSQTRIAAVSNRAGLDDHARRRAVIEQLLIDRLGPDLANEPRFHQVIEQVSAIIDRDADLARLLDEILQEAAR